MWDLGISQYFCARMRTERRIQIFNISRIMHFSRKSVVSSVGRNLEKYQLDGVIFGCKKSTLQECQAKQLFGYSFTILQLIVFVVAFVID